MPDTIPTNAAIFAVVICSILFLAIGLFFNWQTEKQKVKMVVGVTKEVIDYTIKSYWNEQPKPNFPPGTLADLYNEKQNEKRIEEQIREIHKSFPDSMNEKDKIEIQTKSLLEKPLFSDRMKAAKAAKRKE